MTDSLSSLDSWIRVGSAVAVAQVLANSLKNFRAARRLIPIGNMTPSMIEECQAIPLCSVGSEHRLPRALLWAYTRVWIRRSSTKQAFLTDEFAFLSESRERLVSVEQLAPGNRVQTTLAIGESVSHASRSAVRSAVGGELVLAIVSRTGDKDNYNNKARCITVRPRSIRQHDGRTTLPDRTLEWKVINPTGVGSRADVRQAWKRVPNSALWLVVHETREGRMKKRLIQSGQRPSTVVPFHASGSSPGRGFGLALVRTAGRVCLIGLLLAVLLRSEWAWNVPTLWGFILLGTLFYINALMFRHIFSFAFRVRPPATMLSDGSREVKLPWHGSTTRSLALGDRYREVGLAQGLRFQCWEPTVLWIRDVCARASRGR